MSDHGLGRIVVPDARDRAYPLRAALPKKIPDRTYRYWWDRGWEGDQGHEPQCVAYAWLHLLEDGPTTRAPRAPGAGPVVDPAGVYRRAQEIDEWPGTNYDGTSVRGGAKAVAELGLISEYRWAWDLDTVVDALLTTGPVVAGTTWYAGMMTPDSSGLLRPEGPILGGHAYVLNGVNVTKRRVRMKNSWGTSWGFAGSAWIDFDDFAGLLSDFGEACMATEVA